jgi:LysR family transcriptional regulator, regulator of abg operon
MRLEQLQLIQTLMTTGSLRAAAESMHVTAPALTKALQQLEGEFGAALVIRSPKGVRLTPAGELVAARASIALREIERAREEVSWHMQHGKATLTIASSPAAAIQVLPGTLARLRSRWPQMRVRVLEVVYPRGLTMLRAGEVDITIGPLPTDGFGRDLCRQSLFDVQQVIIARASHPLSKARTLSDIQDAGWINTGPPGGPGDPVHLNFSKAGLRTPELILSCESFSTLMALLPSVDALALVPESFYWNYAQVHGLVRLVLDDPLPQLKVYAAWRADAPLTTPAAFLLDALEQEAGDLA